MKKQEKTQKTKERILAAALEEFGSKSYDAASVNSICEAGQIPKGLIYHNFKGKDELYLLCVKSCYDEMMAALEVHSFEILDAKESLQNFLMVRQRFFKKTRTMQTFFSMQCYNLQSIWLRNLLNCEEGSMSISVNAILPF